MTMHTRAMGALLVASTLLAAVAARADFQAALGEYKAGHYDAARAQFLALAEVGDCSSQFNLGAMALAGQGQPKDSGSGVGWLQAAAGNGCERLVGNKLAGLTAKLSTDESRSAAAIVARYGREALQAQGVVYPDFSCSRTRSAQVLESPVPEDPRAAGGRAQSALVITELTIGADGLARDPEVLLAVPERGFAAAAVEAWLNSRFAPATRDGRAVESRLQAKLLFGAGVSLPNTDAFRQALPAANSGDPAAGYLVGLAGSVDSSLGVPSASAGQLLLASARDGNPQAQYWLGSQLRTASACPSVHAPIPPRSSACSRCSMERTNRSCSREPAYSGPTRLPSFRRGVREQAFPFTRHPRVAVPSPKIIRCSFLTRDRLLSRKRTSS